MRDMMWICAAFVLFLSEAWSELPGTNQNITENPGTSTSPPVVDVVRHLAFNLGKDVDLKCSNKTWNETLYVIWTIKLKQQTCKISLNSDGRSEDSCMDGKSLQNTSSAQSYLHIPNFSNDDEGVYKCESVYKGGSENYEIIVAITVPPSISSWLEQKDNKMVAVCKAERGKPAANISWNQMGNSSTLEIQHDSNGSFTTESHVELPKGMDTENLRCFIWHPYWNQEQVLTPELRKGNFPWLFIPVVVAIIVVLAGFLFLLQKKLIMLRQCQQSEISQNKQAPAEDVEEVEPYASYVQRVNSIYNSSADLFT